MSPNLYAKWRRLSRREKIDLLTLAAAIPIMAVAVRVVGLRKLTRPVESAVLRDTSSAVEEARVRRAILRAARYAPYRGNCLSQSLAVYWLLRRRGIAAELRIGARLDDRVFSAHAWVECEGRIVNDRADVRSRFSTLQPNASRNVVPSP